jgi:prepilin-type processing-associated H-X9-DG protein
MITENTKAGYVNLVPTPWYGAINYASTVPTPPASPEGTWANPDPHYCTVHLSDDICDSAGKCDLVGSTPPLRANWRKANAIDADDNAVKQLEIINGAKDADEGWPYPISGHPQGLNVLFCDGSARFVGASINGEVWAKLMTPAGGSMKETWPVFQTAVDEDDFE